MTPLTREDMRELFKEVLVPEFTSVSVNAVMDSLDPLFKKITEEVRAQKDRIETLERTVEDLRSWVAEKDSTWDDKEGAVV